MDFESLRQETLNYLGIERNSTSNREKLLSALGAMLAIAAVIWVSHFSVSLDLIAVSTSYFIVASMGASAVLLFAVPHGALSQPWPLLGGHLVSASIGVSCQLWLSDSLWVAGLAVGLAVGAMYYLRCIHPPGGATALTAVIGGTQVQTLGYDFVLIPVLVNVLAILFIAVTFNNLFPWRRYPAHLAHRHKPAPGAEPAHREHELTQEDFAAAIQQLDSYVDITAEGLTELLELAKVHAERNIVHPAAIVPGRFYSNGKLGNRWSIRQIIDDASTADGRDEVIYKTVAGSGAYDTGLCLRSEFRQWARFEVQYSNGHWVKVGE
ncbi:HPP family protein [Microbulbifer magnicolonia]|uniref:HPP family protein n=1 Tax=Microbulbifer magnicolonia TaxID=3109744 RepID=UPI002B412826|nr:HPP family protein [Microbulbifer sp. GG15]